MPQDAFTLYYLCEELDFLFKGGKVNKIIEPSNDEIVMTIYTGKRTEKLLLNVNPSAPRIGVLHEEKESPLTAPNFCMLMRKHLLSATILGVELIGFDRIVKIDFLTSSEFFDAVKKTLYIELMGRYSNIILTENGKILGGNRGINMFNDGVRPLIVNRPYVFPPVGEKLLPSDKILIGRFSSNKQASIKDLICANVQGVAQSTAKEIENCFTAQYGDMLEENTGEKLFELMNSYLYSTNKNPCVILSDGIVKDVCVYPYKSIDGQVKLFDFLWQAEEYYFSEKDKQKKFTNKKERLSAIVNTAIKKAKKRLTAISAKEKDASSCEENRIKGELLLSNIYRVKNGESECVLENYYDQTTVKIALDSKLSVAKNAENYYKKYNKQKRTLLALKPQKEQAQKELKYLETISDEIVLAENIEDLFLVQNELENIGLFVERKITEKKKKTESFCKVYLVDGFTIRAGRNNTENDKLTFTSALDDIWVHAKDYHSSHVLIDCDGKEVPERVILIASQICAYYSRGRDGGKTEIVYTFKKNVKKPPKSKPGFCVYDNFKSLTVEPQKHVEFLKTL